MKKQILVLLVLALALSAGLSGQLKAEESAVLNIGSKLELFVDNYLIDTMAGTRLRLHRPVPQAVAIELDKPWEGNSCAYVTVFKDGDLYRMYYRGANEDYINKTPWDDTKQYTCYAESKDGINWTKPELGIIEVEGSKKNNVVWKGLYSHNFSVFKDTNPDCKPDEKYKAWGGYLYAFTSPDGLHWKQFSKKPVMPLTVENQWDSQNIVSWNPLRKCYVGFQRGLRNKFRDIITTTSDDFKTWSKPVFLNYSPGRGGQLYTNQITTYYRAPHIYLGFPMRYTDHGWTESTEKLPQLDFRRIVSKPNKREGTAVTEGMFMSSRDGRNFNVWREAFIRPGLRTKNAWFYGDNCQAWGVVETKSPIRGGVNELSIYTNEGYKQSSGSCFRRLTLRIDGFVSVEAPFDGGEFVTKPLKFNGKELVINYSSSAAGGIHVEIQNQQGSPIPGFTLADSTEIYGDQLERVVTWKGGGDVSKLAGEPIRLRFVMRDADLYSIKFRP